MPQIDPKFTFWFAIWTKLLVFVSSYGVDHAPALIQQYAPSVQWVLGMFAQGNDIVLIALIGVSSSKVGPLVGVPTGAVKPMLLLAVVLGSLFGFSGDASAQIKVKLPQVTGNFAADAKANLGIGAPATAGKQSTLDAALAALAKPFQDIAAFIGEDADQAVALSTAIPEIQDGHGQQCWMAMTSFGSVIKAHPVPITFHVMNDYETLRLLAIATNRLCSNVHCTQVFADASAMAQAASPIPLVIPTLHDLCTKVPQIAVVAPAPAPATPAAPAPAAQ